MIEVEPCNNLNRLVIKGRGAEDTIVGANIFAIPVAGKIGWVGVNGLLPCLKDTIGLFQPVILE